MVLSVFCSLHWRCVPHVLQGSTVNFTAPEPLSLVRVPLGGDSSVPPSSTSCRPLWLELYRSPMMSMMYSSAGGDERAPADMDGADLAGGLGERQQREVEATNLVLGLHAVRAVLAWKDWAGSCSTRRPATSSCAAANRSMTTGRARASCCARR
jgi:hypothetical protein